MSPMIGTPGAMDHHERMRMRAAAFRAQRVYPGAAGEVLSAEILAWEEFGYRFGGSARVARLVTQVMTAVIAADAPPPPPTQVSRPSPSSAPPWWPGRRAPEVK